MECWWLSKSKRVGQITGKSLKSLFVEKKQQFIIEAAEAYVFEYDLDMDVQFDIVSILLQGKNHELEHIEDAFQPRF